MEEEDESMEDEIEEKKKEIEKKREEIRELEERRRKQDELKRKEEQEEQEEEDRRKKEEEEIETEVEKELEDYEEESELEVLKEEFKGVVENEINTAKASLKQTLKRKEEQSRQIKEDRKYQNYDEDDNDAVIAFMHHLPHNVINYDGAIASCRARIKELKLLRNELEKPYGVILALFYKYKEFFTIIKYE